MTHDTYSFRIKARLLSLLGLLLFVCVTGGAAAGDLARWQRQAERVTITRDDWGIAHVQGHSDADAVFGMMYAQAQDDFRRIESNYIDALGRRAEVAGEEALWRDLRARLFVDPQALQKQYSAAPRWLRTLMQAWADGLNYFLYKHPSVKPRLITRFEPWMALSFTEGSVGADIERISVTQLAAFYGKEPSSAPSSPALTHSEHDGSNGIAIAPARSASGHALLLINPHTTFFNRSEQHVSSAQGLNVYGAATWGQFFIYQGFNAHAGWMHTSSGVDSVDEFLETIDSTHEQLSYRHGAERRPLTLDPIALRWRTESGEMRTRTIVALRTHHGPIVRAAADGRWVAVALMNKPVAALTQSFLRTKQVDYASFLRIARLQANSSNNTIFADSSGNIAYLHPQFIPKRLDKFDYRQPVDGADPEADWQGPTEILEAPHVRNPPNGWVFNVNDWPWSAAGAYSPRREDYPRYMDTAGPNPRTAHAELVLAKEKAFSVESLAAAAYDSFLPAFAQLIPLLVAAYDDLPGADSLKSRLQEPISTLRAWDFRWSATSVPTSLAVHWGEALWAETSAAAKRSGMPSMSYLATQTSAELKLRMFSKALDQLTDRHGSWRVPWGQINRFQRPRDFEHPHFSDTETSMPVPFTSAQWGSLASFADRRSEGTKRGYGTSGNSFVAVVEFGERIRAVAVMAGGTSADPASPHFSDQGERFAGGKLRDIYFYPQDLQKHTERRYRP